MKLFYGWVIVGVGIVVTCVGIGTMMSLLDQATALVTVPLGDGSVAGPSFEYQPVNPLPAV